LLLDEPFAALDPRGIQLTCRHIRHLKQSGIGILLADHRYETVMQIADNVAVLEHGSVIATGPPSDIATDLRASRSYFPVAGASDTGTPS
jgi:lipopolysaccharide export system ATP-binding protein